MCDVYALFFCEYEHVSLLRYLSARFDWIIHFIFFFFIFLSSNVFHLRTSLTDYLRRRRDELLSTQLKMAFCERDTHSTLAATLFSVIFNVRIPGPSPNRCTNDFNCKIRNVY